MTRDAIRQQIRGDKASPKSLEDAKAKTTAPKLSREESLAKARAAAAAKRKVKK